MTPDDSTGAILSTIFTIGLFVVVAIFIRMLWNIMKSNNIFMKDLPYHYAVNENEQAHISKNIEHFFELATTISIVGFVLFVYNIMHLPTTVHSPTQAPQDLSWCCFCFNAFALVALYIYVAINEPVFAFFHNYKYLAKVWATVLILFPATLLVTNYHHIKGLENAFSLYCMLVIYTGGLGCVTYCVLMYAVNHYSKNKWHSGKRKSHIARLTQIALFANFGGLALITKVNWTWVLDWLACAIIIALAIRFYNIDKTIYTDDSAITVEIINDEQTTDQLA